MSQKINGLSIPRRLSLLDVGARGGLQWPWTELLSDLLSLILVEPDPAEAARLQQQLERNNGGMVLPVALWSDESVLSLNMNRSPGTSSVYSPNTQFLNQFPELDRFAHVGTIAIAAQTVDHLTSSGMMPAVDFAKIDVQGAELHVLKGGESHLSANLVGLEVEVEFSPLYAGQPLFAEIDAFAREKLGLELWDLRGTYWKYQRGMNAPGPTKGRLVFGDALYFRSLSGIEDWLDAMPIQMAGGKLYMLVLSALAYGYVDYAVAVIDEPRLAGYWDKPMREGLQYMVNTRGFGIRPFRNGNGRLYLVLDALARAFKPTHNGWASGGVGLGSRRFGPFWR